MSLLGAFHRGPRRRGLAGIIGPVLRPADPGYAAEIAAFNPTVTRRPGIVVGAQCEDDVVAAVVGAGADGLPVGVKGAGHGTTADPAAPVLISTRRLDAVAVDPRARTARVGAGATWAQVVAAAAPHGLTALVPSSTRVGVAGYTLGGGLGLLGRRYGFAADHLRRLRLVTADGRPHEIDADRAPELHWALRGAGRTGFGVVTELEFELFPLARLYAGGIIWPGAAAADVLHAWREWAPTLPDDAGTSVALLRVPRDAAWPAPLHNRTVVHVRFTGADVDAVVRRRAPRPDARGRHTAARRGRRALPHRDRRRAPRADVPGAGPRRRGGAARPARCGRRRAARRRGRRHRRVRDDRGAARARRSAGRGPRRCPPPSRGGEPGSRCTCRGA